MKISWVPTKEINAEEVKEGIELCEKSRHFANFGPNWKRLAGEAGRILGLSPERKVVPVANGALALEALVAALCHHHKRLFRFAVQSATFPCSAQGLLRESLVVDIAPLGSAEGVGPDLGQLEEREGEFDGVIVTNMCGSCVEISLYEEFCRRRGKILLFDNAATPMSWYKGKNVNDYGVGCAISLHHTKPLGFGEGGLAVVGEEYHRALLEVINFGYSESNRVVHSPYGLNGKMSDIAAIYCLQWLRRAPEIAEKHSFLSGLFREEVEKVREETGLELTLLPDRGDQGPRHNILSANIVLFPRATGAELFHGSGVECKKYYAPLAPTTEARDLYERIICFPLHVGMGAEEIERIGEVLRAEAHRDEKSKGC